MAKRFVPLGLVATTDEKEPYISSSKPGGKMGWHHLRCVSRDMVEELPNHRQLTRATRPPQPRILITLNS